MTDEENRFEVARQGLLDFFDQEIEMMDQGSVFSGQTIKVIRRVAELRVVGHGGGFMAYGMTTGGGIYGREGFIHDEYHEARMHDDIFNGLGFAAGESNSIRMAELVIELVKAEIETYCEETDQVAPWNEVVDEQPA